MTEAETKERTRLRRKNAVLMLLALSLCLALTVGVGGLVSGQIARQESERMQSLLETALPGATVFSEVYLQDKTVETMLGAYDGTTLKGHCVVTAVRGFAGEMRLLVGVGVTGDVTGVVFLEQRLAEGLNGTVARKDFLKQYTGKSGTVSVGAGRNAVTAVSGATRTCRTITEGVNNALAAVANMETNGGAPSGDETV